MKLLYILSVVVVMWVYALAQIHRSVYPPKEKKKPWFLLYVNFFKLKYNMFKTKSCIPFHPWPPSHSSPLLFGPLGCSEQETPGSRWPADSFLCCRPTHCITHPGCSSPPHALAHASNSPGQLRYLPSWLHHFYFCLPTINFLYSRQREDQTQIWSFQSLDGNLSTNSRCF